MKRKSISFNVPAKINLYLRLTGKRSDGYNNLCSIFQKIAIFDHLTLIRSERGCSIDVDGAELPCALKENLIYKAYQLIKKKTRFKGGVEVSLTKKIPFGGGLGGASADAAYTLKGLNELYKLGLSKYDLIDLGAKLGADVPLFIHSDSTMLGIDRGDSLIGLDVKPRFWMLLFFPSFPISTQAVYKAHNYPKNKGLGLTKIMDEVIMLTHFISINDIESIGCVMANDLERPAFKVAPTLNRLSNSIKRKTLAPCMMTGSGSTLFLLFKTKKEALQASKELDLYRHGKVEICQPLM